LFLTTIPLGLGAYACYRKRQASNIEEGGTEMANRISGVLGFEPPPTNLQQLTERDRRRADANDIIANDPRFTLVAVLPQNRLRGDPLHNFYYTPPGSQLAVVQSAIMPIDPIGSPLVPAYRYSSPETGVPYRRGLDSPPNEPSSASSSSSSSVSPSRSPSPEHHDIAPGPPPQYVHSR
jgi:hypothetical protein